MTSIGVTSPVAVITGASSGFGKIYAERLAQKGCDLLLIARHLEKLEKVAAEIRAQHRVEVECLCADLSVLSDVERIEARLETLPTLLYLVNNAGFGGNQKFPEVFLDVETKMVLTHCLAPMRLCRAALIPMKAKGLRRRAGYIINVSSIAGFLAGEGAADYTATKAYLTTFSRSLQCDVGRFGVRVQALCPGFARTGFHDAETMRFSKLKQTVPNFLWQRAECVVDTSLRSLHRCWRPNVVCIPTMTYKLVGYFGSSWLFAPLRLIFSAGTVR